MSTSTSAAVFESYVRTPDFESVAARLELSPELWDIFAWTEQRISAAGVAGQLGLAPDVALLGLRELAGHGLLRKHVQRWNDYRRAGARPVAAAAPTPVADTPPVSPAPAAVMEPPVPVAAAPAARMEPAAPARIDPLPASEPETLSLSVTKPMTPPAASPVPAELRPAVRALPVAITRPREVRFTCKPKEPRRRPATESKAEVRFSVRRSGVTAARRAAAPVEPAVENDPAGWRLRPLLDAIVRRGGGGVQGQLLAYRVFLRVPAELLDRAGLHSLNLVDDDFVVRDPELYAAIRRSMHEVAGFEDDSTAANTPCAVV